MSNPLTLRLYQQALVSEQVATHSESLLLPIREYQIQRDQPGNAVCPVFTG